MSESACPAASDAYSIRFVAALKSRSSGLSQPTHVHDRTLRGFFPSRRPHTLQVWDEGKNRSATMANLKGDVKVVTLDEILPYAFSDKDL